MARKEKKVEAGAPAWMVTYGDMMTLLLTFFVLLVALSEIREDDKYRRVVQSLQETFGYRGGVGTAPTDIDPDLSIMQKRQGQFAENLDLNRGDSTEKGMDGPDVTVKKVRDGPEYCIGGTSAFEQGRAELLPQARKGILEIAEAIRGYNFKIELRGHSSKVPLPTGSPYADHVELGYQRARTMARFLIDAGLNPRRIRVSSAGAYEPKIMRAGSDPEKQTVNDRVEITLLESLIQEFEGGPNEAPPDDSGTQADQASTSTDAHEGV